jgi:uncharacterized protein
MRIRVIPRAEQPVMPWANGGGSTRQVAIDPPDGSLQRGFRWRVSCAQVASDGPFSRLPGVDRSLWLVRGRGMRLRFAAREVVLMEPMERVDFCGEDEVAAQLLGGPCEDCNVMTRRGEVACDARVHTLAAGQELRLASAPQILVLVVQGRLACHGSSVAALSTGDAIHADGGGELRVVAEQATTALVVRVSALRASQ